MFLSLEKRARLLGANLMPFVLRVTTVKFSIIRFEVSEDGKCDNDEELEMSNCSKLR